ncbi:MAG: hypothetical protein ACFKPT_27785 [Gloeotrichia echinulata GP01]
MKKKQESVHSSPTNIADFAMLNFARWSIRHSRAIHPTLIRVSVGLLSGKLNRQAPLGFNIAKPLGQMWLFQ